MREGNIRILSGIFGIIIFVWGFIGLKKTYDLKNEKTKEEIRLLQIQQHKIDVEIGRIQMGEKIKWENKNIWG